MRTRLVFALSLVAMVLCTAATAGADDGQNAQALAGAAANGAAAAAAAAPSGPVGMLTTFLLTFVPSALLVLLHQAATHWKLTALQTQVTTLQQNAMQPPSSGK